jgi:chaperonin GroEL (HSP60 family)
MKTPPVFPKFKFDGGVVINILERKGNFGFDAGLDLVEAGIIDPTKVIRIALDDAILVASGLPWKEATTTETPRPAGTCKPGGNGYVGACRAATVPPQNAQ